MPITRNFVSDIIASGNNETIATLSAKAEVAEHIMRDFLAKIAVISEKLLNE